MSPGRRRLLFVVAAVADLCARVVGAGVGADQVLFGGSSTLVDMTSVVAASGVAVPVVAAPLVLSPLAFMLGQMFVVREARYVRFVSVLFFAASFLTIRGVPGLSILLAVLAYLILGSGMRAE